MAPQISVASSASDDYTVDGNSNHEIQKVKFLKITAIIIMLNNITSIQCHMTVTTPEYIATYANGRSQLRPCMHTVYI